MATNTTAGRSDRDQQSNRVGDRAQSAMSGGKSTASGDTGSKGGFNINRGVTMVPGMADTTPGALAPVSGQNLRDLIGGKPTATGSAASPPAPAQLPGVDPATLQNQQGRVVLDPYTAQPLGVPDPNQGMIGGPMGSPVTQGTLDSQQAIGMARAGLAPAGSAELGNALNARHYYNDAMKKQNEPGVGGWLARNLSFMGLEQAPVNLDQPQSYADGSTQLGLNPVGAMAGAAGMVAGVPALGTLAGAAYHAFGGQDAVLTGGQAYSPYSGQPVNSQPRSLPPGFRASGGTAAPAVPSSTPSASVGSSASQPVQASTSGPTSTSTSGASQPAFGQSSQGGGTIITGSNTVAWPWSQVNG